LWVTAGQAEKIMQCHTQNFGNACLSGSAASSASKEGRSLGYKWIMGSITTSRGGQRFPKVIAVTRVSSAAWRWFSEGSRSNRMVH
jgi:hypothetical protein